MIDVERAERETARWRLLRAIQAAGYTGVLDETLWRVMADLKFRLSHRDIRNELSFLSECGCVRIEVDRDDDVWTAKLTALGTNITQYARGVEVPAGINRPPRE